MLGMTLSSAPLQSDVHVPNCTPGSTPASKLDLQHHFPYSSYHPVLHLCSQFSSALLILLCSFHHVLFWFFMFLQSTRSGPEKCQLDFVEDGIENSCHFERAHTFSSVFAYVSVFVTFSGKRSLTVSFKQQSHL